jgi:hypothetical protein
MERSNQETGGGSTVLTATQTPRTTGMMWGQLFTPSEVIPWTRLNRNSLMLLQRGGTAPDPVAIIRPALLAEEGGSYEHW